jgi:hypothetical protein
MGGQAIMQNNQRIVDEVVLHDRVIESQNNIILELQDLNQFLLEQLEETHDILDDATESNERLRSALTECINIIE